MSPREYSERILAGVDWGQGFWYSGLVQKDNEGKVKSKDTCYLDQDYIVL
jgi:hypothetical protein